MKLIYRLILCFVIVQLFTQNSIGQSKEYMLKAGFLEKFARLSEWPKETAMDTFKIAVIGESPFNGALEKMYSDFKILDKPVKINYIATIYELENSQILFISASENENLPYILAEIENKPVLTVGETKGYARKGVMINFYETNMGTVHFEINRKAVRKSGIKMDVMLLNFAKLIE